jgi:hypothetical protein
LFDTIRKIAGKLGNAVFPTLKKSALIEQINKVRNSLSDKTIPAYKDAYSIFDGKQFKDKELQSMDKAVKTSLSSSVNGFDHKQNMIYGILKLLEKSSNFIDAVSRNADKLFNSTEATTSLKLRQAYIISLVNNASFADKYARMLLNFIYSKEMCAISGSNEYKLVQANEKKILEDFDKFLNSIRVMNRSESDLNKSIDRISEYANADGDSVDAMIATQSMSEIDPLSLGYITDYSPFYIIGMWEAEIRAWFVRTTEDEIELLTRRRIRLEQLYEGKNDAFADKEIDAIQRRIDDSQADMDDYRRRYGI